MPTPRPDTLVTCLAVEKPGRKSRFSCSRSLNRAASSEPISPRSSAFCFICQGSMPVPSSLISMFTWPPSWKAERKMRPSEGLPAAARACWDSMPWSTAFRTRCVRGSLMASMMVLSSSVSLPSISMRTFLLHSSAKSRTSRGNRSHTLPMGCMRVFMTRSCSSVVIKFKRWEAELKLLSFSVRLNCRIWLRTRTNSPTRFISLSSSSTGTRMLVSATVSMRASLCAFSAWTTSFGGSTPFSTRISPTRRGSPWRCSSMAPAMSSGFTLPV